MIPTNLGEMSPIEILGELMYIGYAHNRDAAPHIKPQQYAKVYGDVAELEARYQSEKAIEKARYA